MKKNQFNTDFDKITCEGENMLLLELLLGAEKSWHYYIFFFFKSVLSRFYTRVPCSHENYLGCDFISTCPHSMWATGREKSLMLSAPQEYN